MRTVAYSEIKNLTAFLAGRADDTTSEGKLTPSEATMLRALFASELTDLWVLEAWPELCDNLESVTLDANKMFDKREGETNEMGEILTVREGNDPRINTTGKAVESFVELDGRVNVTTSCASVWVDWQLPVPDLLDDTAVGGDINTYELPERFKQPLAFRGAAYLLAQEDPALAGVYKSMADEELKRQRAHMTVPWWRLA